MRRFTAYLFVLLLAISAGCSKQAPSPTAGAPANNPKVEIKIESERATFKRDQDITIMITIKNLTAQELDAPETYWSASVLLDGKEYKRLAEHTSDWNGPGVILPNGGLFSSGLTLSEYGIKQDALTLGKHEVVVKIEDDLSNVVKITIEEGR